MKYTTSNRLRGTLDVFCTECGTLAKPFREWTEWVVETRSGMTVCTARSEKLAKQIAAALNKQANK